MTTDTNVDMDNIHIPQDTARKIDFIIRGVKEGKFDEVVKKVEFGNKLSGEFSEPQYVQNLLKRIDLLEDEKHTMKDEINSLRADLIRLQSDVNNDMNRIAKAVQYFMKPDPLASELYDIGQFIDSKGARKY